jgi:hypothetical protein
MFQRILDRVMARADGVRREWKALCDGYRFGRDLAAGRSAECPMCHMTTTLINKANEQL